MPADEVRLLHLVFPLLSVLAMAGCKRVEEGRTSLLFSVWGSVEQQAIEEEIVREFETAHPDIDIQILCIGSSRYAEKIQAMMVGDVAPDVMMVDIATYDEWASRGVLTDVTEDVRAAIGSDTLMPVPERAFAREGRYFAAPVNAHGFVLYANLDALAKAGYQLPESGISWDDFLALGARFAGKAAPTDYLAAMPSFDLIAAAFGVHFFNSESRPTEVVRGSPELRDALTFYRKMRQSGYFAPPDVIADQGAFELFRDGRAAFHLEGRWRVPDFASKTKFAWDAFKAPAGPVGAITQHGGTGLGVWAKSAHPEVARQFLQFYASARGMKLAMKAGRIVPPLREVAFGEEFLSQRPPDSMVRFSETMEKGAARVMLYAPGLAEVRAIVNARTELLLYAPNVSVAQVQQGLEDDLERWLRRRR